MPVTRTAPCGTVARWRTGCRCDPCTDAHNGASRRERRRLAAAAFPAELREQILTRLAEGQTPADAARALGIHVQAIWGYARSHPDWLAAVDDALMTGRNPEVPHGTPSGSRTYGCPCPECRAAHHAPATVTA